MTSCTDNGKRETKQSQAPRFDWPKLRKAIEFYQREGLCYLPARWGRKNPALDSWEEFQIRLPTIAERAGWFHEGKPTSIGVVCGGISRGLVILAFNEPNGAREFFGEERWQKLPEATFITKSVRGHHVWLRSDTPIKSQTVRKGKNASWLETRADGNFTIAPPSLHPDGVLYEAIGVDRIYKPDDLAGFITRRLVELGLREPLQAKEVTSRRKKHPPCLESISRGVDEQQRDAAALALARHYLVQAYEPEEVFWLLQEWDTKNKPPLNDIFLLESRIRIAESYRGLVCSLIKDKPTVSTFCVGDEKCDWPKPKREEEPRAKKRPERSDEFNTLAIEKLLESCSFIQYCRDNAITLAEPWWWSTVSILVPFGEPGRKKIHELSAPYEKYTEKETDEKIKEALKAGEKEIGPHTCIFVEQDLGFSCPADCLAKKEDVKSPAGLATRLASRGLHVTIDGVTYFERLDINRIISRTKAKEDAPPTIKTLASFTIEPRMRITLEGESERLDTVLKTGGQEYPCLFRREAWNSKRQLLAALPSVDLQYYGTDKDTQAILAMVTSKELPIRKGATVLGRHGEMWVVRDGVLSKDGWLETPELVYIPSEVEFDKRVRYPSPEDEIDFVSQVIPLLLMLNEGKIIFPVLGWFFATPFVPEIRRRLRHFPLLVIWGTHGGGKSSLLNLLWRLFGVESELFSSTETPFTFLRLFSGTSTIPIIIDEFKPFTMKEDETRLLIRFLKRLYDGEIEHRGRPDLSLVAYHLQAPTAIAGEVTPIALESAMVERVIQVNLNPDTLTTSSPHVSAFRKLQELELQAFALPYVQWCLGANLDELMTETRALLPPVLADVPPRVKDNCLIMATGLVALKRFAAEYGVQIAEEVFRTGVVESVKELLTELFERGAHEEIGLTIFLETLATLAQTGRVKHGVQYSTDDIDRRLYIHLPDCIAEFRKFVRETNARVEVLDARAYRRQAREVCERKGYILNTFANKWFKMYETEKGLPATVGLREKRPAENLDHHRSRQVGNNRTVPRRVLIARHSGPQGDLGTCRGAVSPESEEREGV